MTSANAILNPTAFPPGLVAVPCLDWMYTEAVLSLIEMRPTLPPGSGLMLNPGYTSAAASRNQITGRFLSAPEMQHLQWLCFVDADMTPPPHTVLRLLMHGRDVVSGMYFSRNGQCAEMWRVLQPDLQPDANGLLEVEAVGGGCLLVSRRVFRDMQYPWFDSPASPGFGEDFIFCKKLRDRGHPIFLDTNLTVGHLQVRSVGQAEALQFKHSSKNEPQVGPQPDEALRALEREYLQRPGTR